MIISNKLYDAMKWVAQFLLPGLATLYFALSAVWGLPHTEEIVGTIVAVNVFLGALLGISNYKFKKEQDRDGYIAATSVPETYDECDEPTKSAWVLSEKWYQIAKWVTLIALPAAGTLYFTLSQLWMWPYGEQVVGTVAAVTAFTGLLLGVSTKKYKQG